MYKSTQGSPPIPYTDRTSKPLSLKNGPYVFCGRSLIKKLKLKVLHLNLKPIKPVFG